MADADWVIEAIVENLAIKRALMARLVEVVGADAIVSTNTSGIPISEIAECLPRQFKRRFLGTHFFNPPRYLRLLEIIPQAETDPDIVDFMLRFGAETLGKGTVRCKDTPNFIANRFMLMSGMQATNYALDQGYGVEEVDALTGPLIGRPKTATFHLNDLVGFDVHISVARNLYHAAIPDDPARDLLRHAKNKTLSDELLERGWLGRKTGRGFYHMRRDGAKRRNFGRSTWTRSNMSRRANPASKASANTASGRTAWRTHPLADKRQRSRRSITFITCMPSRWHMPRIAYRKSATLA